MSDIEINCLDCQTPFLYTEADQAFYAEKQFTPPKRCKACRQVRKDQKQGGGGGGGSRSGGSSGGSGERRGYGGGDRPQKELFDAVCSDCGKETQVPFKPSGGRPVLCRDCFKATKSR